MLKIHRSDSIDSLWQQVAVPWLESCSELSGKTDENWNIVVPHHAYAHDIKRRWLREKRQNNGLLGLRFLTPPQCRQLLTARRLPGLHAISKNSLQLLIAASALQDNNAFAKSLEKDPALFADTLLSCAFANIPPNQVRELLNIQSGLFEELEGLLHKTNLQLPGHIDWQLSQKTHPNDTVFNHVLLWGFDASHWPLLALLQAVVVNSTQTHLLALSGWVESTPPEALWQSTWEAFARKYKTTWQDYPGESSAPTNSAGIFLANDDKQQAELIFNHLVNIFSTDPDALVLVALPARDIIHSELILRLQHNEIPALDMVGTPDIDYVHQALTAWIEMQKNWDAASLLQLLGTCPSLATTSKFSSADELAKKIQDSAAEFLTTDLHIIQTALCCENSDFVPFSKLPEKMSLADFQQELEKFLQSIFTHHTRLKIPDFFQEISVLQNHTFPMISLLEITLKAFQPPPRKDTPQLRELFARVVIAPIDFAPWISKTHLILSGQNEHNWPPRHRSKTWLDRTTIENINRSMTLPSPHGVGEHCVSSGKAILLSPVISEQIAIRNTLLASNNISTSPILFASALDMANNRPAQPSSILTDILSEQKSNWQNLIPETAQDFEQFRKSYAVEKSTNTSVELASIDSIQQLHLAYLDRRNSAHPFGKYDFSYLPHAPHPHPISAKILAQSCQQPAYLWFNALLRVRPIPDPDDLCALPLFVGNHLHAILKDPLPNDAKEKQTHDDHEIMPNIRHRLEQLQARFVSFIHKAAAPDVALPVLLQFALLQLRQKTFAIAEKLQTHLARNTIRCEVQFPDVTTADGLRLSARIDAILTPHHDLPPATIIDYKSGGSTGPASRTDYLQLYLYREILAARGITAQARTITADGSDAQLPHQGLPKKIADLYLTLHTLYQHACFPILAPIQDAHTHTPELPIALLDVPTAASRKKLAYWLPQDQLAAAVSNDDSHDLE